MTLFELKATAAAYLGKSVTDLTVNGVDLGLAALNQVRLNAELQNDFEFSRKLVTLDVDGVTGGSLDDVVTYVGEDSVEVKSVIDVGQFDEAGNLLPAEWSTVSESLIRQREENPSAVPRYPTDGQAVAGPWGGRRFLFSGSDVFFYPKVDDTTFTVGIEVYTFTTDWVDDDLAEDSTVGAPWTTRGHQYLLWASVVHLNNLFKEFVFRQEGNLPPPQTLADQGLASLISWDIFRYEQFRRHGR
jgi:hypothetical protein